MSTVRDDFICQSLTGRQYVGAGPSALLGTHADRAAQYFDFDGHTMWSSVKEEGKASLAAVPARHGSPRLSGFHQVVVPGTGPAARSLTASGKSFPLTVLVQMKCAL